MGVCSMFYRFGIHICDLKTRSTIDVSPSARTRRAASGLVRFPAPLVLSPGARVLTLLFRSPSFAATADTRPRALSTP